jgi:hypothetical protein
MTPDCHSPVSYTRAVSPYRGPAESIPTWNDARMNEFAKRSEENFREVRKETREVEAGLRTEMDGRFARLEDKIETRRDILFGALATGFVAAVVQQFLG